MTENLLDIAIIGAGPAGLSAAVAIDCFHKKTNKNINFAVFDKEDKIGKSILKTGNGRCNFSNYFADKNQGNDYNNPKFCKKVFTSCKDKALSFNLFSDNLEPELKVPAFNMFEYLGLSCNIEDDGRMYPYTGKAQSVVDVFSYYFKDNNIKVYSNHSFQSFSFDQNKHLYKILFENDKVFYSKKIIFATGHFSQNFNFFDKISISPKKVLGPIKTNTDYLYGLDGVRAHVNCRIEDKNNNIIHDEDGEILFRKYGLSGICIFNLSRFVDGNHQSIIVDFAPENTLEELYETLIERFENFKMQDKISAKRLLAGMMLPQIVDNLCKYSNIDETNLNVDDVYQLSKSIKNFRFFVKGIWDDKYCQITRGGINTEHIMNDTLELKNFKNIYVAGEIVDVDGPCGGFNLHWAWTSGILAGISSI